MAYIGDHSVAIGIFRDNRVSLDRLFPGGVSPAEQTISGTLPLTFESDGTALTSYRINGYSAPVGSVGSGVVVNRDSPIKLNGTDTGINFGAIPLYDEEYADFSEQKVYQVGNYLDSASFENGYYPTSSNQWQAWQSSTTTCCIRTPFYLPQARYTGLSAFTIVSDIPNLRCCVAKFNAPTVSTATAGQTWWGSDQSLPFTYTNLYSNYPYITLMVFRSDWSTLNASDLNGHVWIRPSNLSTGYMPKGTLVGTSISLPTLTPNDGANTISYTGNPCEMEITGRISEVST